MKSLKTLLSLIAAMFFLAANLNANGENDGMPTDDLPPPTVTPIPVPIPPPPPALPILYPDPWYPPTTRLEYISLIVSGRPNDADRESVRGPWAIEVQPIDNDGRPAGQIFYGTSEEYGFAVVEIPDWYRQMPLVITAYSTLFPPRTADGFNTARRFETFLPPNCWDQTIHVVGPVEDALWSYYKKATTKIGRAWNPSDVSCGLWEVNLQNLINTREVQNALNADADLPFPKEAVIDAIKTLPEYLTPTRMPICIAERRHHGGTMSDGEQIALTSSDATIALDDNEMKNDISALLTDSDPVTISAQTGQIASICGISYATDTTVTTNGAVFAPKEHYWLDEHDFMGTIHKDEQSDPSNVVVTTYNTRLGNGAHRKHGSSYDDACAVSSVVNFTNLNDYDVRLNKGTGININNLFGDANAIVHMTSSGDTRVHSDDTWAIFKRAGDELGRELVVGVEFLGHRKGDFRDTLEMRYDEITENLFLGVKTKYSLNDEGVDGDTSFMRYTIHVWDGSTQAGRHAIYQDLANCYDAADPWSHQFFDTNLGAATPVEAAEYAVHTQCFSNSRKNQSWLTYDVGFWSMNSDHGVSGNVIVNAGWLAPNESHEIYIQKFDEAQFRGPRGHVRTDATGQFMTAMPTLVEGDRVLVKQHGQAHEVTISCEPDFYGYRDVQFAPWVPGPIGVVPVVPFPGSPGLPAMPPPPVYPSL